MVYHFEEIKTTNKPEFYHDLLEQAKVIIDPTLPVTSNLSNLSSLIFYALNDLGRKVNWTGFYLSDPLQTKLLLGPFQGRIACTVINFGKGVCGTTATRRETIVVKNVEEFSGHIACDSKTKSEIVVPILVNESLYGVLDLDALELNEFDEDDKTGLEAIVAVLVAYLKAKDSSK